MVKIIVTPAKQKLSPDCQILKNLRLLSVSGNSLKPENRKTLVTRFKDSLIEQVDCEVLSFNFGGIKKQKYLEQAWLR